MSMDAIPIWVILAATIIFVMMVFEAGSWLGRSAHRRTEDEKESPVGAIAGSILGLTAFMLAFTFGIVTDRYDARKALVRDEANAIGTAYLRSDFLPEPDRGEAKRLFREYVEDRVAVVQSQDLRQMQRALDKASGIQQRLWSMAVTNARNDMNSDVAALYIESLNAVIDIHSLRVVLGMQARIPPGIWVVLSVLVTLGMIAIGYQAAIAGSGRSLITLVLAVAFSIVIALIASLDRPQSAVVAVSQRPLANLRASMAADIETHPTSGDAAHNGQEAGKSRTGQQQEVQ